MNDEQLDRLLYLAQRQCQYVDETDDELNERVLSLVELCDGAKELVAAYRELGRRLMDTNVECNQDLQRVVELEEELAKVKSELEMVKSAPRSAPAVPPKPKYTDGVRWEPPQPQPEIGPDGFPRNII
jgi:hypothetical protein